MVGEGGGLRADDEASIWTLDQDLWLRVMGEGVMGEGVMGEGVMGEGVMGEWVKRRGKMKIDRVHS